jgi:hypothetical protein
MKTVIGLFEDPDVAQQALRRLPLLGLDESCGQLLDTPAALRQRMECGQQRAVLKWAAIGGLLVAPIIAIFAVLDAQRAISLGIDSSWAIAASIGLLLGGIAIGAFIGGLWGRDEIERETHLYLEGVRRGCVLAMVTVDDDLAEKAMNILRQQGGLGVRICTRVRQVEPASSFPHAGEEVTPLPPAY